jgi:hypothetical protein
MPAKKSHLRKERDLVRERFPNRARADEIGIDPGQVGPESAGLSGDVQGLSRVARSSAQSIEELAGTDQSYEASLIEGVEDAGAHPGRPVRVHSDGMLDDVDDLEEKKDRSLYDSAD